MGRGLSPHREYGEEQLSTRDLLEKLIELEEAPWAYLEKFNPSILARLLNNYGIKPRPFSGGKIRGYARRSFEDSWSRYLEPLEAVTPVTPNEINLNVS